MNNIFLIYKIYMFQLCLFVVIHLNNQSKEDRQVTIEEQKSNLMLKQEAGNDDFKTERNS